MKVEIVFILDNSGSMMAVRNDAIGGFNSFLADQKAVPGEASMTLVLFNYNVTTLYDAVPLEDARALTVSTYQPGGFTALLDAIGITFTNVGKRLEGLERKPDKVIVAILTDGQENASREYTHKQVADMIKHQQEKYSWEVIFLAANQDAFLVGESLNIKADNTSNYVASKSGTRDAYRLMSNTVRGMRL